MKLVTLSAPAPRVEPHAHRPATLTVEVEHPGNTVVLIVAGELDLLTASHVHRAVDHALLSPPLLLVIDLGKVGFLDCTGINVLLAAQEQAGTHTRVRVLATARSTLRTLRITGVDGILPIYPSRGEAVAEPQVSATVPIGQSPRAVLTPSASDAR